MSSPSQTAPLFTVRNELKDEKDGAATECIRFVICLHLQIQLLYLKTFLDKFVNHMCRLTFTSSTTANADEPSDASNRVGDNIGIGSSSIVIPIIDTIADGTGVDAIGTGSSDSTTPIIDTTADEIHEASDGTVPAYLACTNAGTFTLLFLVFVSILSTVCVSQMQLGGYFIKI
uniref:uncharacterized protein LOC105352398 n=1 Tax=Fragaria vesca subsp. vesca TaxID=101020 RepID=UPI0005CAA41F|nr:PREDICTED: uncharacterized protein LOC105352398 [Fragaria vesca subsp. vesca]